MQTCTGRFVNPISDICWECLFPISIGPIAIGSAMGAPDTPNPSSPICLCGLPIPRIGLSVGVWEPARLLDVTRTPWCFPNLGGHTINPGLHAARGRTGSSGGDGAAGSVWHAHLYMCPLLSWIGALLDLGCLEAGGLDIAWTSELDPAWLDDELSFLLNPEAALFANLPAQAACAADCAASSTGLPLDPLFWCAGCQGGMYPLTGNVTAHVGGVQASLLTAQRLLYWLHRAGLAWGTAGSGALCGRYAVEKTHANGRFEVAGVPRGVIVAFSTRQTEIETAMAERGLWRPADHPRIAKRVALFTRPAKRVADRSALRGAWERRAADLGFDARALVAEAEGKVMAPDPRIFMAAAPGQVPARDAAAAPVAWATAHLSERGAVFKRAELLAGALGYAPGTVTMAAVEREVAAREEAGTLHAVSLPSARDSLAIDRAAGEERETAALMRSSRCPRAGRDAGLGRRGAARQGTAHGCTEGSGEADPVSEGKRGRRSGRRRRRQDRHARSGTGLGGEEGLASRGTGAVGLGGKGVGGGGNRERIAAAVSRTARGCGRGAAYEEWRAGDAGPIEEDDPGGRRGHARQDRAGSGSFARRAQAAGTTGGAGGGCELVSPPLMPASRLPCFGRPACRRLTWAQACGGATQNWASPP